MRRLFNARNWYWSVGNSTTEVFSSSNATTIPVSDPDYQLWLQTGCRPKPIPNYSDLYEVIATLVPNLLSVVTPQWITKNYLTPQQALSYWLNNGVSITSTTAPSLNGSYDISLNSQAKIAAIISGINAGKGLPGGGSSFGYADKAGNIHMFALTDFENFGTAIENYVYSLYMTEAALLAGNTVVWPQQPIVIA